MTVAIYSSFNHVIRRFRITALIHSDEGRAKPKLLCWSSSLFSVADHKGLYGSLEIVESPGNLLCHYLENDMQSWKFVEIC